MNYQVTLVKDRRQTGLLRFGEILKTELQPAFPEMGLNLYGAFFGLFGLATNEVYLVTNSDSDHPSLADLLGDNDLDVVDRIDLTPTARPEDHTLRTQPGVYVFRWFDVLNKDVDEIVSLSKEAWVTFEGGFDTEVQGLFALKDRDAERGKMLLITWYRDLAVWQDSRQPPKEAADNFRRRHELTIEAKPICTRLFPL